MKRWLLASAVAVAAHAGCVRVQSYETIADPVATDHCGLVLKAALER